MAEANYRKRFSAKTDADTHTHRTNTKLTNLPGARTVCYACISCMVRLLCVCCMLALCVFAAKGDIRRSAMARCLFPSPFLQGAPEMPGKSWWKNPLNLHSSGLWVSLMIVPKSTLLRLVYAQRDRTPLTPSNFFICFYLQKHILKSHFLSINIYYNIINCFKF